MLHRTIFIRWGVESLYMTLLVKAARKTLWSGQLCSSAVFGAVTPITFSIQYISLKKHHQKCARAEWH